MRHQKEALWKNMQGTTINRIHESISNCFPRRLILHRCLTSLHVGAKTIEIRLAPKLGNPYVRPAPEYLTRDETISVFNMSLQFGYRSKWLERDNCINEK